VLGLREVMDAPHLLDAEWKQRDMMQKIGQYYDAIWVYGPRDFYDPLVSLDVPPAVREKMDFVGYLQRSVSTDEGSVHRPDGEYLLVTTGGGGDGEDLVREVIEAYQRDPTLTQKMLIVLGPYMKAKQRLKLTRKAAKLPQITVIQFDTRMEELIAGATAVVAMGGYNTFCEILSFDKRALIVPRVEPRQEQLIRAQRAAELGLVDMLLPEQSADPLQLAAALKALPTRLPPSQAAGALALDGLGHIGDIVGRWLNVASADRMVRDAV